MYRISAATQVSSLSVLRESPADALDKVREFEALGLEEIRVTDASDRAVTTEELRKRIASVARDFIPA